MINHKERNITWYQVGEFIGKGASASNGSSGFKFWTSANNSVISTSNMSGDQDPSASSATDGYQNTSSKSVWFIKRQIRCNHSKISETYQQTKGSYKMN
jgi:beta-glucanase (GH16 family)